MARRAARRALLADAVRRAGVVLLAGSSVGLLAAALDRLNLWRPEWWAYLAVATGVAAMIVIADAWRRRWSLLRAAVALDHALGLRDRLSSGLALSHSDDPFAGLAQREAEHAAQSVSLRRAVPVRPDWRWGAWPVVAVLAVVVAIFLPRLERGSATEDPALARASREAAAREIAEASRAARDAVHQARADPATAEQLATLDEIERELADARRDPREARAAAADAVERLANRLEDQAEREQAAADSVRERMARAAQAARDADDAWSDLARAIGAGDAARAADTAERLAAEMDRLDPATREQLARELEDLARSLAEPRSGAPEPLPTPPLPLDEQALERLASETDPREIEKQLRDAGLEPEAAEQAAREIAAENRRRQAEEEAQRREQELRRAAEDAARELREPPKPRSDSGERPPDETRDLAPNGDQREPRQGERQRSEPREGQPRQGEGERGAGEPKPREDEAQPKPTEGDGDAQQPASPERAPGETPKPVPGEERESEQGEATPGESETPRQHGEPRPTPGDQGESHDGRRPDGQQPGEQPGRTPRQHHGGERGGDDTPGGVKGFAERLRELARPGRDERERARDLREHARRLLGREPGDAPAGPWPDEREFARDTPPPDEPWGSETTPIDARDPRETGEDGRVVAQWFADGRRTEDGASHRVMQESIREAARSAEEALEQQAVPPARRDLVRRVFERYQKRAESQQGGGG
ncbi:MAG: hypothetical protein DYG93_13035 [Leptolyngbya sp. PLA2]|nr:hypothetical protein [Leptolyngbya sp.]MCE7972571.1 hypothetical protein [Leptolyngbya sp. PL-A2]MCQ3939552.1 hypothetical protein [cyanobacterium CYA1]GIK18536.1 MAG: hypothetical protein BroJett004_07000 [Planctomycetota bacterium]